VIPDSVRKYVYYEESGIVLLKGDCLEILPLFEPDSIDLVLTDPPYGIGYQSNMRNASNKFSKIKNDVVFDIGFIYRQCFEKMSDGVLCTFVSFKNYARDYLAIETNTGFNIKNAIIWNKGGGGIGDLKHSLLTDYEVCIVGERGKVPINGKRIGSVWNIGKVPPESMLHPTEKPVELFIQLINKFMVGADLILDPFLGSGTTAVAAKQLGRKCIGIEIEEKYLKIAKERLRQEVLF
jgi:site-specific DNA-methyltransferase (adenine-specific)